jgi:hypothetical protein
MDAPPPPNHCSRLASIRRGTLARFTFRADRIADLGPGSVPPGIEIRYPGIALPWYRGSRFSVRGLRPGGRDILSGDHGQRTPRKFHWLMDRQKKARIAPGLFAIANVIGNFQRATMKAFYRQQ